MHTRGQRADHAQRLAGARLLADRRPDDVKQPGASAKTCTAARWWLDDVTPAEASALGDELQERLASQPAP
jgi:hypothetical protein